MITCCWEGKEWIREELEERGNRVGLIKTYDTHVRTYEILNFKKQRMTGLPKALLLYPWLIQSVTSSCSSPSKTSPFTRRKVPALTQRSPKKTFLGSGS